MRSYEFCVIHFIGSRYLKFNQMIFFGLSNNEEGKILADIQVWFHFKNENGELA